VADVDLQSLYGASRERAAHQRPLGRVLRGIHRDHGLSTLYVGELRASHRHALAVAEAVWVRRDSEDVLVPRQRPESARLAPVHPALVTKLPVHVPRIRRVERRVVEREVRGDGAHALDPRALRQKPATKSAVSAGSLCAPDSTSGHRWETASKNTARASRRTSWDRMASVAAAELNSPARRSMNGARTCSTCSEFCCAKRKYSRITRPM